GWQSLSECQLHEPLALREMERVSRHQDCGYSLLAEGGKRIPQLRKIACLDRHERQSGLLGRRLGETQESRKVRVLRISKPSNPGRVWHDHRQQLQALWRCVVGIARQTGHIAARAR